MYHHTLRHELGRKLRLAQKPRRLLGNSRTLARSSNPHRRSPHGAPQEHSQQLTPQHRMSPQTLSRWSHVIGRFPLSQTVSTGDGTLISLFGEGIHDAIHRRWDITLSPYDLAAVTLGQAVSYPGQQTTSTHVLSPKKGGLAARSG